MTISCSRGSFSGSFWLTGVLRCLHICCALLWVLAHSEEFSLFISLDLNSALFCFCVLKIMAFLCFPGQLCISPSKCVSGFLLQKLRQICIFLKPELVFLISLFVPMLGYKNCYFSATCIISHFFFQ